MSVFATVLGIYINAAINFTRLLSDRTKDAYERIEAINLIKVNSVDIAARACFEYAHQAKLSKAFVQAMWEDYANNPNPLPLDTDEQKASLYRCLSAEAHSVNLDLVAELGASKSQVDLLSKLRLNAIFARIIHNYMNAFEPAAHMTEEDRLDTQVFCDEIPPLLAESDGVMAFMTEFLRVDIAQKKLEKDYPGLYWYQMHGAAYGNDKAALHYDNSIIVLFPFLKRPQVVGLSE